MNGEEGDDDDLSDVTILMAELDAAYATKADDDRMIAALGLTVEGLEADNERLRAVVEANARLRAIVLHVIERPDLAWAAVSDLQAALEVEAEDVTAENARLRAVVRQTIGPDPEDPDAFTFLWPEYDDETAAFVRQVIDQREAT